MSAPAPLHHFLEAIFVYSVALAYSASFPHHVDTGIILPFLHIDTDMALHWDEIMVSIHGDECGAAISEGFDRAR